MRDAGGARLREPQRFLAPRRPQPFKVKLADQGDAPSPSQAEGAMPSGAILTKAGAIRRNRTATPGEELHQIAPDCTRLHQIAPDCTRLHQIAPDCTRLHQIAPNCTKKSKRRKPGRKKGIPPQSMGNPPSLRLPPPPSFRRRQTSADKLADKSAGQVGVRRWRGGWTMENGQLSPGPSSCQKS